MRNIIFKLSVLLLAVSVFFSCDISLGEQLNIDPPIVKITAPDFLENVSAGFTIEGTATDKEEISVLTVTMERVDLQNPWTREWIYRNGAWESRSSIDSTWTAAASDMKLSGIKNNISWEIWVDMSNHTDGDYLITAGAVNNVQNKGPLDERRVVVDTKAPVVTLLTPDTEKDSTYNNTFNAYKLKDPALFDKLFNQRISIQYEIKEDYSLKSLSFQLVDSSNKVWYDKSVSSLSWSGKLEILAEEITDNGQQATGKTPLKIISEVSDKANNSKTQEDHGWICWWPEADKPWVVSSGTDSSSSPATIYPESDFQLLAYDDDGVGSVTYTVYKGTGSADADAVEGFKNITVVNESKGTSKPSRFFSFSFPAPVESGPHNIVIKCVDINNPAIEGDSITHYFNIASSIAPSVEIDFPLTTETLFGDGNGDFKISGTAYDGQDPVKVQVVWIKPGNNQAQFLDLLNPGNGQWTQASDTLTGGNKRMTLSFSDVNKYDAGKKRFWKPFSETLNLFNLGVGSGSPIVALSTQTFVFRVEGKSGSATTLLHSVQGDINPPTIELTNVSVESGGNTKTYTKTQLESAGFKIPTLRNGDKISVTGTWGDDSFDKWKDKDRMGTLEVTWNGTPLPSASLAVNGTNRTWSAGPLTLTATQAGGRIEAKLFDLGGNMGKATLNAKVEAEITGPFLQSYSSPNNPPGTYKAKQNIDIILHFNSAYGALATNAPTNLRLELNVTKTSGATAYATYNGSITNLGDHKIGFRYTVEEGDDVDTLNVEGIEFNYAGQGQIGYTKDNVTTYANSKVTEDFTSASHQPFKAYTNISIKTGNPVLESFTLNPAGTTLTLNFDREIYKKNKDDSDKDNYIVLEQPENTYRLPAVLSKSDYLLYSAKSSALSNYYTKGTNGTDSSGNPDLTEKYILKYDLNTDPVTTDEKNARTALINAGANKVTVAVASSTVTVVTSNQKSAVNINLSETSGNFLRVKGVTYTVTLPKGAIQDVYSNILGFKTNTAHITENVSKDSVLFNIDNPGVNAPVIRVQKQKETIANSANNVPTAKTIYKWAPVAEVSLTQPANTTGWTNYGRYRIGPKFIAYAQAAAPNGSKAYFRLQDLTGGASGDGTGRLHGNQLTRNGATSTQFNVDWGNGGYNTTVVTGDPWPELTAAIRAYGTNIWVSVGEQDAASISTADGDWGAGIIIHNLWLKVSTTASDIKEGAVSPDGDYINVGVARIDTDTTGFNSTTLIATQHLTTGVKIDSQTPGADIRYTGIATGEFVRTPAFAGPFNMGNHKPQGVTMPSTGATKYSGPLTLGDTGNLDGYLYAICAQIYEGNVQQNIKAYEKASRSVIMFNDITEAQFWNNGNNNLVGQQGNGNQLQLWIRGGDSTKGESLTPGFPLSWDDKDYSGIRLMTRPGTSSTNTGTWYWVSWEVNTTAYFHFIAGVTPNNATGTALTDIQNNGPTKWSWAKNAWALQYSEFCLYPGGSLLFTRNTVVSSPATENFEFYNSFAGTRP